MAVFPDCKGEHPGFECPGEEGGARFGQPDARVDTDLLAALLGAAYDGCMPCRGRLLDRIEVDPLTACRLVEMCAGSVQKMLGGLPDSMTTDNGPWAQPRPFRMIVAAGIGQAAESHGAMFQVVRWELSDEERREAVEAALDILIGQVAITIADIHIL